MPCVALEGEILAAVCSSPADDFLSWDIRFVERPGQLVHLEASSGGPGADADGLDRGPDRDLEAKLTVRESSDVPAGANVHATR